MTVEELYAHEIRRLPTEARLKLMALIAEELAGDNIGSESTGILWSSG